MSIENIQAGFCLASLELQVFKSLDDLFPFYPVLFIETVVVYIKILLLNFYWLLHQ